MKLNLEKRANVLIPADKQSEEFLKSLKHDQILSGNFAKTRNYKYHKKWFALINYAFEHIEFGDCEYKGIPVKPNFERFRKDIIILTGNYIPTFDIDGKIELEAKSISFASMDDTEFSELYSKTIDVVLDKVLKNYGERQLNEVILEIIGFV